MESNKRLNKVQRNSKEKMPFHKGSSLTSDASEGGHSVSADDKKKNQKKPETKLTATVTTSVSKASKDKKAMMTTTRSNSTGRRGKAPVASHSEQKTPKRSRSTGGGKQVEGNAQEVTV